MRTSIIVPARDAQRTLPRTLQGLHRQPGEFEVIVVDNGSLDATARTAQAAPGVTHVIRRHRGDGPGAARSAGVAAASGEALAFIDADCWPADGWLVGGLAALGSADLVQGRVLPDPEAKLGPFDRTLSVGSAHGLFESANLFVRRDLFERVGGFSMGFEPAEDGPFGEDVRFGWAARRAGGRTAFAPDALAYHEVSSRGPLGFVSERARYAMFPALAAEVPELREAFFYRRWFHSRRSAAFDLALLGVAAALATRQPRTALLAAVPYLQLLNESARRWGPRRAPAVALTELAADAYAAVALARGSVKAQSLLL